MVRIVTQLDVTGSLLSLRGEYISITDVTGSLLPLRGEYISVTACCVRNNNGWISRAPTAHVFSEKNFFFKSNIFFNITHILIYIQG